MTKTTRRVSCAPRAPRSPCSRCRRRCAPRGAGPKILRVGRRSSSCGRRAGDRRLGIQRLGSGPGAALPAGRGCEHQRAERAAAGGRPCTGTACACPTPWTACRRLRGRRSSPARASTMPSRPRTPAPSGTTRIKPLGAGRGGACMAFSSSTNPSRSRSTASSPGCCSDFKLGRDNQQVNELRRRGGISAGGGQHGGQRVRAEREGPAARRLEVRAGGARLAAAEHFRPRMLLVGRRGGRIAVSRSPACRRRRA